MDLRPKASYLRPVTGLLLALCLGAFVDAWRLAQIHRWNRALAESSVVALTGELPQEVRFAQAYFFDRQGKRELALALYQEVINTGSRELAADARYNSANIYLRWALDLRSQEGEHQALPLIELAKQGYRDLLRKRHNDWDARYNLERALRLVSESEEESAAAGPPPLQSERAITTMRGFTLGLP